MDLQSRSSTLAGAAPPSLSPLCSVPASPSASERELQVRTHREIATLGQHLGKMSITSCASKDDRILPSPAHATRTKPRSSSRLELRRAQSLRSANLHQGMNTMSQTFLQICHILFDSKF